MKKIYIIVLTLLFPLSGVAQLSDFDINVLLGAPQGEFQDNLDRTAVGINGGIAYPIAAPFYIGAEIGFMTYGRDERTENFNPNIPEVRVNVVTEYDILTGHAFLRFEGQGEVIRPYIDGLVGFNYLFTKTTIEDRGNNFDDIASDTNFDDTALSYGFGPGIKFRVSSNEEREILINLKTRYLFGANAAYLQPGSIEVNNGSLIFDESESKTDLLTIHLGVSIKF
ncbi:hypothetical protein [Rhodohalobacter sulfatireducens]|uniref:Outer membrane protein beta-barrel domain-containing protein n=1 Tax=Rhodohalobacter sulfatireducens TaxID=2911366 RepID=A0ABS9KJ59_9BACT|nr:hypothetical protein [Rhodohalobacter sulfatireducens]MCG2590892.1 hypothetical protein [Rhodohalobacter sulfatireducens]